MKDFFLTKELVCSGFNGVEVPQIEVEVVNGLPLRIDYQVLDRGFCSILKLGGNVHFSALREQHL